MNAKRGFRCRILDIALWTDYGGRPACVVGAYGGVGDARVFAKTDTPAPWGWERFAFGLRAFLSPIGEIGTMRTGSLGAWISVAFGPSTSTMRNLMTCGLLRGRIEA